jgi:hypothetical protein
MTRPRERLTTVVCETCHATTTKSWDRTCGKCATARQSASGSASLPASACSPAGYPPRYGGQSISAGQLTLKVKKNPSPLSKGPRGGAR